MTDAVKPIQTCPFCGDSAVLESFGNDDQVVCTNCNAMTARFYCDPPGQAIAAWNTRTPDLLSAVREARAALATADAGMTCRRLDHAHYCPNCDNTTFAAREAVRTQIAKLDTLLSEQSGES